VPGNQPRFPRFRPGDRLPAEFLNDVAASVELFGRFGDQVDGLATGAGVYRRGAEPGARLRTFELTDRLQRTTIGTARRKTWNGSDWETQGSDVTIYGDFYRGVGFAGDLVQAIYLPIPARWYALGCGQTFVRGKIATDSSGFPIELNSGGAARLDIWVWDHDANEWVVSDPLERVEFREAIGLTDPLATGDLVLCTWHEQSQQWIATHAPCPEE